MLCVWFDHQLCSGGQFLHATIITAAGMQTMFAILYHWVINKDYEGLVSPLRWIHSWKLYYTPGSHVRVVGCACENIKKRCNKKTSLTWHNRFSIWHQTLSALSGAYNSTVSRKSYSSSWSWLLKALLIFSYECEQMVDFQELNCKWVTKGTVIQNGTQQVTSRFLTKTRTVVTWLWTVFIFCYNCSVNVMNN